MFSNKFKKFNKSVKTPEATATKQHYFKDNHRTYSCIHCRAHLASHDELISKLFQGNHGRAYLFNKVVNVGFKQTVRRQLLTGPHTVADIYCENCETTLGWKYEQAFVAGQKYKEGKYIIEVVHMFKENSWDINSYNAKTIMREIDFKTRKKFDSRDFKIGENYFGSISIDFTLKAKQNSNEKLDIQDMDKQKILRVKSLDQQEPLRQKNPPRSALLNQSKYSENLSNGIDLIERSNDISQLSSPITNSNKTTNDAAPKPVKDSPCSIQDRSELNPSNADTQHDRLAGEDGFQNCPIN